MIGNKRFGHHLNKSTTKNQIHIVDHFPESKGLLFHAYDNQRHPNYQTTKGEYGPHMEYSTKSKYISISSPGEVNEHQIVGPHAMS